MTITAIEPPETRPARVARPRLDHVDAVRPIKQLGVVTTHSITTFAPAASLAAGAALTLTHVSREAFIFVSACMLAYANPVLARISWRRYFKRRLLTIALPYTCWTLIYWASTGPYPMTSPRSELDRFEHLFFTSYWQLYYLVVVAQFYVLFPLFLILVRAVRRHPLWLLGVSAGLQGLLTGLMHWNVLPWWTEGGWATREVWSYQLYLVGGCLAAAYLEPFERWLVGHARLVLLATLGAAALAEGWFLLAVHHPALGLGDDPLQPIVVPFNIGAILCLYLLGRVLVDGRRSARFRRLVRRGSDNSYGIFLSHTLIIGFLVSWDWGRLTATVPWPVVVAGALVIAYTSAWLLTAVLAYTPLAQPLTGRARVRRGTVVVPMGPA